MHWVDKVCRAKIQRQYKGNTMGTRQHNGNQGSQLRHFRNPNHDLPKDTELPDKGMVHRQRDNPKRNEHESMIANGSNPLQRDSGLSARVI